MKRVAAILGAVAICGALSTSVFAQARSGDQKRPNIEQIRADLQKLQRELKQHEEAMKSARKAGNRELAQRELQECKRIRKEIKDLQAKAHRAGRGK